MNRSAETTRDYGTSDEAKHGTAVSGDSNGSGHDLADEAEKFFEHARLAAQNGVSAVNRTIQQNPTLALAGLVAFGAVAAIAIRQRRQPQTSTMKKFERELLRNTRSLRKSIRDEIRSSGLEAKANQIGAGLASIDWKPYIQPVLDHVSNAAEQAKSRISAAGK
jgi:hypothetical protein